MNISTAHTAAVVATGLAGIAVFQMALAFGAPLGRAAWGGTQAELPTRLRFGSAASAVFLSVGALIVLGRSGYWSAGGIDALLPVGQLGDGPVARSGLACQLRLRQPVGALPDGSDRAGSVVAVRSRGTRPRCCVRLHPSHRIAGVR